MKTLNTSENNENQNWKKKKSIRRIKKNTDEMKIVNVKQIGKHSWKQRIVHT
jgi:hypothetical protein